MPYSASGNWSALAYPAISYVRQTIGSDASCHIQRPSAGRNQCNSPYFAAGRQDRHRQVTRPKTSSSVSGLLVFLSASLQLSYWASSLHIIYMYPLSLSLLLQGPGLDEDSFSPWLEYPAFPEYQLGNRRCPRPGS